LKKAQIVMFDLPTFFHPDRRERR